MNENEIQVVEVNSEKGASVGGTRNEEQLDYAPPDQGRRSWSQEFASQDFDYIDDPLQANRTVDGLPIQTEKTGRTLFLRRQVQMMSISTRIPLAQVDCRRLHRTRGFLLHGAYSLHGWTSGPSSRVFADGKFVLQCACKTPYSTLLI